MPLNSDLLVHRLRCALVVAALGVVPETSSMAFRDRCSLGSLRADESTVIQANQLADLNKSFRIAYANARKETLLHTGPVIEVSGNQLVLLRNGKRTKVEVIPKIYHDLKAVSHVPITIYLMLDPLGAGDLTEKRLEDLRAYRDKIAAVAKQFDQLEWKDAVLKRQQEIAATSISFLDRVLEAKKFTTDEVIAYTREQKPRIVENLAGAAQAQLDAMHKQVMVWKSEMTTDEWKNLRVVIMGTAMPRKSNLATLYFARLLGETGEGLRVVYTESIFDEERALNLLGTNVLDSQIAVALFDDKMRMHRDVLADVAEAHIKQMKFEP